MSEDTYARGMALLKKLHGGHVGEQMVAELGELSPELMDMTIRWGFGEVVSREGIDLKTRRVD
jgi:4-carboxymuconolactone decarboxylase